VVSDNYVISFEIEGRASNYMAGLDSRSCSVNRDSQIAVRKADHSVNLVRLPDDNFMDTLRSKLHWGLDKRN
jgi:NAD+ kinase